MPNYKKLVDEMPMFKTGIHMSLKIHFLQAPLDSFPENCGIVSDEHSQSSIRNFLSLGKGTKGNGTDNVRRLQLDNQERRFRDKCKGRPRKSTRLDIAIHMDM